MKKKKVFICILVGVILLGLMSGGIIFWQHQQNKAQLIEEKRKEKEAHEKLVAKTKEDFNFYLTNNTLHIDNEIASIFNQVIAEDTKNQNINYNEFLATNLKNLNLTKLTSLIDLINQEINNYNLDTMQIDINALNDLNIKDYDKETLIKIYQSHNFFQNLDSIKNIRQEYLTSLTNLKNELTKINDQSNQFYLSNNKYLTKNDSVKNSLQSFSDKYHLNLTIEKEFLVPILCYHGVLNNPWGISSLFVRVNEFETQMKYLSENGYTPLFVSELSLAKNYEKPIIITFDDGYLDVYTNAFPILKKYNIKANIYMISAWINGEVYMTTEMTKEMGASPLIEVGSHTVDHQSLAYLSTDKIENELKNSKETLESMLNQEIKVLAYPKGSYDNRVINIAKKYYKYALSTNNGMENPDHLNKYTLNRIYVYRGTNLTEFKKLL